MAMALVLGSVASLACAQGEDPSLTKEFPKLSPKERSRIAAKETAEAEQDQVYQSVMREAETAFQEGRYEDALADYERARTQRPYNVYPKVKIQDLKALLKRKEEEDAANKPKAGDPVHEVPVPPAEAAPAPMVAAPSPVVNEATTTDKPANAGKPAEVVKPATAAGNAPPPAPAKPVASPPATKPIVTPPPAAHKEPAPADKLAPTESRLALPTSGAMEERRYQEGHAWVIERTVNVEGRRMVYKRVAHPFGQVFFFEDGVAVDERVWNARFP